MENLKDRTAIVTGGAQGLGAAICGRLAAEGCNVIVADLNEPAVVQTASKVSQETGKRCIPVKVDVTAEDQVENMVNTSIREFGRLDIVVSNAGVLIAEDIADFPADKWKFVMNVNLFGYFLTAKHAARAMKQRKSGVIIQINSKSGKKPSFKNSAYAASKFGGIGLTESIALDLAPHGIRVNAICPGNLLDSPLWSEPNNGLFAQYLRAGKIPGAKTIDDVRNAYVNQVPMRRGCSYEDVCNAVVFLASDQSSYMTGQAVSVTGGQ
ncbi:MAG: sorbitol-6-phosphate dehydrogenase [bacterium]